MTTSFIIDEYDPALGYHPSVTPLDIQMGITTSAAETSSSNDVLRWGILATGKVAHDFVQTLKFLRNSNNLHDIVAVGSRTIERAREFGTKHKIRNAYGSYKKLCNDSLMLI